jgi:aminoglycoside 2'-N-acetyltransferase I
MIETRVAHTAEVDCETLGCVRALLNVAFERTLRDRDWEHVLGGVHALVWDDDQLIGHGSVVQRRIVHGGRALRAGYVEGVAVRIDRRASGHGAAIMRALERVIRRAYEVGALDATGDAATFYLARGWQRWAGRTAALTPNGTVPTPQRDHEICVLPVAAPLDTGGILICDWRDGDLW